MNVSRSESIHRFGAFAELTIALRLRASSEMADGVGAAVVISEEIQPCAIAPRVTRERFQGPEGQPVGQGNADFLQDFVENPTHRENSGACVHLRAARRDLAHFSAGRRRALDHGHGETTRRKQQGRDQPANSRANDQNPAGAHRHSLLDGDRLRGFHAAQRAHTPWPECPKIILIERADCVNNHFTSYSD